MNTAGPYPLIIFDGPCGLCHRFVKFVLAHDRRGVFRFTSRDTARGHAELSAHGVDPADTDSVVLVTENRCFVFTDAVFEIMGYLRPPWNLLRFGLVIPRPVRDSVYRLIAANRYRFFGSASCDWSSEYGDRFLS